MAQWMKVEPSQHQVTIAGHVTDAQTHQNLGGVQIRIIDAPTSFVTRLITLTMLRDLSDPAFATQVGTLKNPETTISDKLAAAQWILDEEQKRGIVVKRPDLTCTAVTGLFYFLDLADGAYTLQAMLPGAGTRYSTASLDVNVLRDAASGQITLASADLALLPTGIAGQITTGADNTPVILAEVRVQGSGERVFTDQKGNYRLTGLEAGKRTLLITAPGYTPAPPQTIQLSQGVMLPFNIALTKK